MKHCATCPRATGTYCLGEHHKRVCSLRDPGSPDYDAEYRNASLAGEEAGRSQTVEPDPNENAVPFDPSILESYKAMHGCRHRRVIEGECPDCVGMCSRDGDEVKRFKAACFECIDAGQNL